MIRRLAKHRAGLASLGSRCLSVDVDNQAARHGVGLEHKDKDIRTNLHVHKSFTYKALITPLE